MLISSIHSSHTENIYYGITVYTIIVHYYNLSNKNLILDFRLPLGKA
jgi:hypothetical protein